MFINNSHYWFGETECRADDDRRDKLAKMGEFFSDEDYDPVQDAAMERLSQIKTMLNLCGIGYENFKEPTPENDFYKVVVMQMKFLRLKQQKKTKHLIEYQSPALLIPFT